MANMCHTRMTQLTNCVHALTAMCPRCIKMDEGKTATHAKYGWEYQLAAREYG